MKPSNMILKNTAFIFIALSIPAFLALQSVQGHKYTQLENQLKNLEKKQHELIEDNKHLISEIGMLSGSSRIEKIAVEELGMHQASSADIVRVQVRSDMRGRGGGRAK